MKIPMKELNELKVGDPVMARGAYNDGMHRTTISRIGRKYIYTGEGYQERGYDKKTGRENSDRGSGYLETLEHYDLRCRALTAERELKKFGVTVDHMYDCPEKTLEVRAALDVLISTWQGP